MRLSKNWNDIQQNCGKKIFMQTLVLDDSSFSLMSWHHIFCSFHQKIDFSWLISQKTLLRILYKVFAVLSFQKITLFPSETLVLIFFVNRMFLSTIKLNLFVFNWRNNELLYSTLVNTVLMFLFKPIYLTFSKVTSCKMAVRRLLCQLWYLMTVCATNATFFCYFHKNLDYVQIFCCYFIVHQITFPTEALTNCGKCFLSIIKLHLFAVN